VFNYRVNTYFGPRICQPPLSCEVLTMPKKSQKPAKSVDETQELSPATQPPCSENEVQSFLTEQLNIPLDEADQAVIHLAQAGVIVAPYTSTKYDDIIFGSVIDSAPIRRWVLARILSIGQSDPQFLTMNSVSESSLPEPLKLEMDRENLNIGQLGDFLIKYGPIIWGFLGPLLKKKMGG
jgi:hypothetical protein